MATTEQTMEHVIEEIKALRAREQNREKEMAEMKGKLVAAEVRSNAALAVNVSLVDAKEVQQKVKNFSGKKSEWKEFALKYEAKLAARSPQITETFRWLRNRESDLAVTMEELEIENESYKELTAQLHMSLLLHIEGDALPYVTNVSYNNGLEAYRKLLKEYEKRTR